MHSKKLEKVIVIRYFVVYLYSHVGLLCFSETVRTTSEASMVPSHLLYARKPRIYPVKLGLKREETRGECPPLYFFFFQKCILKVNEESNHLETLENSEKKDI